LLSRIIDEYRIKYHEVYVKAYRYLVGTRVRIYGLWEGGALFRILGDEETHWVYFDGEKFFCSCLDFFYNITMKSSERRFCSHILAGIMLLARAHNTAKKMGGTMERKEDIKINIVELVKIINSNIEYVEHGFGYEEEGSSWRDIRHNTCGSY